MKNKVPLVIIFFVTSPLTFVQMTKVSYWNEMTKKSEEKLIAREQKK